MQVFTLIPCIFLFVSTISTFDTENYLRNLIKISGGLIQGIDVRTERNTSGIAFMGIPLAQPPIGSLRFARSEPALSWEGVLPTSSYRNACLSDPVRTYKRDEGGPVSEDCLYINVFTSRRCLIKGGCAVISIIHGGRYTLESAVSFKPEVLINNFPGQGRDVIAVTLPYRLGFLGFFNLDFSEIPRNLAVYDLKLGLEWIQKEIHNFGGDPKRVTIYGHSAGAQMADPISMSPPFQGLFSAIILQSGNGGHRDTNEKVGGVATQRIIRLLNCTREDDDLKKRHIVKKALNCLKTKTSSEILKAEMDLNNYVEDYIGLSLDGYFFPEMIPKMAMKRKQLPTLTGTVTGEMDTTKYVEDSNGMPNLDDLRWICRAYIFGWGYKRPETLIEKCIHEYNQANRSRHLFDDPQFFSAALDYANSQLGPDNPNVYLYSYKYSQAGRAYSAYQKDRSDSPLHSEDYIYVLGLHRGTFIEKDYEIERIYTGMIVNFAKYHNASFEKIFFPRFTRNDFDHLIIDFDQNGKFNGQLGKDYYRREHNFWDVELKKIGGERIGLSNPPIFNDNFDYMGVSRGRGTWRNRKQVDDKTLQAALDCYYSWDNFFEDLERKYIFEIEGRSLVSESNRLVSSFDSSSPMLSTVLLIGGILMLIAIGLVSLMKFLQYRKRNTYQEIS